MDVENKILEKLKIARKYRPCTLKIYIEEDNEIGTIILKPVVGETKILYIRLC